MSSSSQLIMRLTRLIMSLIGTKSGLLAYLLAVLALSNLLGVDRTTTLIATENMSYNQKYLIQCFNKERYHDVTFQLSDFKQLFSHIDIITALIWLELSFIIFICIAKFLHLDFVVNLLAILLLLFYFLYWNLPETNAMNNKRKRKTVAAL